MMEDDDDIIRGEWAADSIRAGILSLCISLQLYFALGIRQHVYDFSLV